MIETKARIVVEKRERRLPCDPGSKVRLEGGRRRRTPQKMDGMSRKNGGVARSVNVVEFRLTNRSKRTVTSAADVEPTTCL